MCCKKIMLGGFVLSSILSLGVLKASGDTIGPVTFTLTPDATYTNQLDLTVSLAGGAYTDSQPTTAGGTVQADLEVVIDPNTYAATVSGITYLGEHYTPSNLAFSDMTFTYAGLGGATIEAHNLRGTLGTPVPPGTASGANPASFPADLHALYLNSGTFVGASLGIDFDLSTDFFGAASSGTGTITVGDPVISGNQATYAVELLMPLEFTDTLDESGANTMIADGTIHATGSFTQTIPEPGTLALMFSMTMSLIVYGWFRRRR